MTTLKKNVPGLRHAKFLVIAENNMAHTAQALAKEIHDQLFKFSKEYAQEARQGNYSSLMVDFYHDMNDMEDHQKKAAHITTDTRMSNIGFKTTPERKPIMVYDFNNRLVRGLIQYHKNFLTTSTELTATDMKLRIHGQLLGFGCDVTTRGNITRRIYSGKRNNGKSKDDLVMTLIIMDMAHKFHVYYEQPGNK